MAGNIQPPIIGGFCQASRTAAWPPALDTRARWSLCIHRGRRTAGGNSDAPRHSSGAASSSRRRIHLKYRACDFIKFVNLVIDTKLTKISQLLCLTFDCLRTVIPKSQRRKIFADKLFERLPGPHSLDHRYEMSSGGFRLSVSSRFRCKEGVARLAP